MINHNKQFQIKIRCHDLDVQRKFQILNPSVIVKEQIGSNWIERGETEIQQNQRNPTFQQGMCISYQFQTSFLILFEVYHVMNEKKILIGRTLVNIVKLLTVANQIFYTNIELNGSCAGKISIFGEYYYSKSPLVELNISTTNLLLNKWCMIDIRPKNPFIKIFRQISDKQDYFEIKKINSIRYPQQQTWPTLKVQGNELCNDNFDDVLRFQVCDKQDNQEIEIGEFRLTINQIIRKQDQNRLLKNIHNQTKGEVKINCKLIEQPTFEEYLKGGLQLNLMIAIDFTKSNGSFSDPNSLHYFNNEQIKLSQYEIAMMTIAKILIEYDHDKKVPLFGFGCVPQGQQFIQHCYPLNGNFKDPEVHQLNKIFQTYRNFVPQAQFSGPTYIHPTIKQASEYAEKFKKEGNNNYVVLTILTDGEINDFEQTVEKIVSICDLPISIIIIGVGNGKFGQMEKLDKQPIDEYGNKASRDLVKFVEFKKFFDDSKKLASEVLSELPNQIVEYMQSVNKQPNQFQGNTISFLSEQEPDIKYFQEPIHYDNLNTISRLINDDYVNFDQQVLNDEQVLVQSIMTPKSQYYVRLQTNDQ